MCIYIYIHIHCFSCLHSTDILSCVDEIYIYIHMWAFGCQNSPNSVATLGFLTVSVKARCSFEMYHPCPANLVTLTAQKFSGEMSMCISTAQARTNRVSRRPLFRGSRFTSAPGSFLRSILCGRRGTFGTFSGLGHRTLFHARGKRGTFCTLLRRLGTVGKNEGCFWRSFFVAGAVFGKLGRCFERAEKRVLWNCRRIWFGAWWWWCIFCGRRSTSWTMTKKWLRPR